MPHKSVSQVAKDGNRSKLNETRNVYQALNLALRPLMAEYKEALAEVKSQKSKMKMKSKAAAPKRRSKKQQRLELKEVHLRVRDLRWAMTSVAQSCKDGMLAVAAYQQDLVYINVPFLNLFRLQQMSRSLHLSRRGRTSRQREKVTCEIRKLGLHVPLNVFFRTLTVSAKYSREKRERTDIETLVRGLLDKATGEGSTSESKEEGEFDPEVDVDVDTDNDQE